LECKRKACGRARRASVSRQRSRLVGEAWKWSGRQGEGPAVSGVCKHVSLQVHHVGDIHREYYVRKQEELAWKTKAGPD